MARGSHSPTGSKNLSTGYLEQRLTPEGVELMRSEVISTGLFDENLDLAMGIAPCDNFIEVRNGDGLVRVFYGRSCGQTGLQLQPATPEQLQALVRLDGRLADPASWLPAGAWEDRTIRAYVPSTFAACYSAAPRTDSGEPSRILALLPESAADLLRGKDLVPLAGLYLDGPLISERRDFDYYCSEVTTEEARTVADAVSDAGFERDEQVNAYLLQYNFSPPGPIDRISIWFEPIFPDGDFGCSACG